MKTEKMAQAAKEMAEQVTNDKLLDAARSMLYKAIKGVESTGQFVFDQIPDVFKEYLLYKATVEMLWFVLGTVFLIIGLRRIKEALVDVQEDDNSFTKSIRLIGKSVFIVAGAIIMIAHLEFIAIYIAPKGWLLNKVIEQVSSTNNCNGMHK